MARRDELARERGPWGFSFYDVPERQVGARCIARLPESRVLPFRNRWGSEFYAIFTRDGRLLHLHRTGLPANVEPVETEPELDCGEAAWIVGRWHRNYYHWLLDHLPKVMLLQDVGADRGLLIPGEGPLRPVIDASLEMLGVNPGGLRTAPAGPMRADPLWVVEADRFDADLLRALRRRIVGGSGVPSRRVYLSREQTVKRRLSNTSDVLGSLGGAGFERVKTEGLAFQEQVALASRTAVLLSVHGAGLTNMIFLPEGAHVVEIANPRYPSPVFYALASALGLRYWLVWGKPIDDRGPGSLDVQVDPREIRRVVAAIEKEER